MEDIKIEQVTSGSAETQPPVANAIGGAFEGADRTNRAMASWGPPIQSPDRAINTSKPLLDARATDLANNDGYILGALSTHRDSVVGSQFLLNSQPDFKALGLDETWAEEFQEEVESLFGLYAESNSAWIDASRVNTLTSLVRLAVVQFAMQGETLATAEWIREGSRPYRTALQMIDPHRLCNPYDREDDETLRRGIVRNRYGAAQGYWFRQGWPNDPFGMKGYEWRYVPAEKPWGRRQVIHIVEQLRPDQTRGVAEMAAVLKQMRMTSRFQDITLQNAVVNATYAASIETELPREAAFQTIGEGSSSAHWAADFMKQVAEYSAAAKNIHIDGVKIPHLYPGTKLQLRPAGTPGGVGTDFEQSLLRHVAAALGLSYEQFSRDYTKTNYSSARASMNETGKYMGSRKKVVAERFASECFALWLEEAINTKRITALPRNAPSFYDPLMKEAYTRCTWIGASRGQIDELKETQAAMLRVNSSVSTLEEEAARLGKDFRQVLRQRAREKRMLEALGLAVVVEPKKPGTMTQLAAGQQEDTDKETTDED